MKKIVLILIQLIVLSVHSQSNFPYSANNICLDYPKPISNIGSLSHSRNLVIEDFDNDGYKDVLMSDTITSLIYVFKNQNGTGFIGQPVATFSLSQLSKRHSIEAADFDKDSKPDIALCSGNSIKIFKNTSAGTITFSNTPNLTLSLTGIVGLGVHYMKTGNLNNDDKADIVVIGQTSFTSGIAMMAFQNRNQSVGTFSFSLDYSNTNFFNAYSIKVQDTVGVSIGDYNNDNTNDVLLSIKKFNSKAYGYKNITPAPIGSSLSFSPALLTVTVNVPVINNPSIAIWNSWSEDVDGDSKKDIFALSEARGNGVAFNGVAYFGSNASNLTYINNFNIPLIDAQNNQLLSLITVTGVPAVVQNPIIDFKLADMNGDNLKDIVAMNSQKLFISFQIKNPPQPNFPFATSILTVNLPTGTTVDEIEINSFDNNNLPDIFYKPNKLLGPGGVIANFSHKLKTFKNDSVVCNGVEASFSVNLNPPPVGISPSANWYVTGQANPVANTFTATTWDPGVYYPQVTFPFPNANASSCTLNILPLDSIKINAIPDPVILTSTSNVVCAGVSATLSAGISGTSTAKFDWLINGNIIGTGSTIVTPSILSFSIIQLEVKDNATKCFTTETIYVNTYTLSQEQIAYSKNPICLGDSAQLSYNSAVSYSWSNQSNKPFIYVAPVVPTDYSLVVTDANGCVDSKFVRINIDKECSIKVYNTVTLNNDGNNDILHIDNIMRFPNNRVMIFNRWGEKIYDVEGYDNKNTFWPKKGNESDLVPSTYFYVIDLKNGSERMTGWIELIK